ncbi:MAG: carboxy-S-adenosyl-L-methionine synthase CmoA [Candidatus Omnitrophica bacterium]|nr:carboxy-S-adenosyl-L-methionine synthase CmoA [Candidatus Omnitrophota bacterium]
MGKDALFTGTTTRASDFEFDRKVADVFDDMVVRSVPFYRELQCMVVELAKEFFVPGGRILDLGCSTGTTLINLYREVGCKAEAAIGYDNSEAMLAKGLEKLERVGLRDQIQLKRGDLTDERLPLERSGVVTMCWVLQFLRPPEREGLIRRIHRGMLEGGALIVIDKVLNSHPVTNRAFVKLYYDYKRRNGYSDEEIVRKREALENVLIPYRMEENLQMFRQAGFEAVEPFFQWYNFAGFLCVKV